MKRDLCVFVVDDMALVAYTLCAILRDHGHAALPYTDPLRALSDARHFMPDVLISDVEMPLLDGVDLARQMLKRCPQCKVFLMSGHIGPLKELERARADGFELPLFAKPLSASVLTEQLDAIRAQVTVSIA